MQIILSCQQQKARGQGEVWSAQVPMTKWTSLVWEEIKATVSGVLHPAPPLREKELKKEFHVEAAAEQEFLGSEIDFTLVCLSIKHQASSITKIYPKWESTLILRIVILAASVLCRYGFS